ncbi:MAG: hypothetical protein WCD23_05950 [Candidatus Acidiferrales bacterium]
MMRRCLLALSALILFAPSPLHACGCSKAPPGACPGLQKDDVVFLGTVTAVETLPSASAAAASAISTDTSAAASTAQPAPAPATPITHYRFRVDERFAGTDSPEVDVFSGGDDGDCGSVFKKGDQYVVFTQQENDGRLFSTICGGSRTAVEGRAVLPQLRAMRNGERVASVFGVIHRSNPPLLEPTGDPEDPLGNIPLKLRSKFDRFSTAADSNGVYSFYDVHAGKYNFTARLPARMELSQKTVNGPLPPIEIPNNACYEFDVDALPIGKIRGSVLGRDGHPLPLASVELYRADRYDSDRPGLWGFQGEKGSFEFDHIGPGDYILVFNRPNRMDPTSPYPRTFYPHASSVEDARPIHLKDAQDLQKVNVILTQGYPTRVVRVQLKWPDGRVPGDVYVTAKADQGESPAARKIGDALYELTIFKSARYTFIGGEDPDPGHAGRSGQRDCSVPAHIDTPPVPVDGADEDIKEVTLLFPSIACEKP